MGFSSLTVTASKSDVGSGLPAPNSNRPVRWPPGAPMTRGNNAAKEPASKTHGLPIGSHGEVLADQRKNLNRANWAEVEG
jgi:hypothetical protein